jgi:hypothetical protein
LVLPGVWLFFSVNGNKKCVKIALQALLNDPDVDAIHIKRYLDSKILKGEWFHVLIKNTYNLPHPWA